MKLSISRRSILSSAVAAPMLLNAASASAQTTLTPAKTASARSFQIGKFIVTTLLDGTITRDDTKNVFGQGVSDEEFARVSKENFISPDKGQFYFTPTLVYTGSELVLFDTGLGGGGIQKALADVGVTPEQIDIVVITHMHGDHIGGLKTSGATTFPNARYVTAAAEYDFWTGLGDNERAAPVRNNVVPLAEKTSFIKDGESVVSGITAVSAAGHTPGHTLFMLESEGQQLLLTADLANHYVLSFLNPEWPIIFDNDKDAAATSRRKILDMLATDRVPMIGYHMPFPGMGFVETRDSGFRFVPVGYQFAI